MQERARRALTGPGPWLAMLAVVLAAPTLSYPFGRDQAHHFYVAWSWLEGAVPYRDTFHDKQPMLYLTHLLGIAIGGVGPVGIRIVDLLATLVLGALVVHGVERDGRAPARGEVGAGMVLAAAFYFGTFDYWDTAHAEYWQAIWLLGAWVAARRVPGLALAAASSGVLSSVAVLYKPTAGVIAVGVAAALASRAWSEGRVRSMGVAAAAHAAGGLAPLMLFVAYFASQGALRDWYECTVLFPSAYANTPTPSGAAWSLLRVFWLNTASGWVVWCGFAWAAAMVVAWREREGAVARAGVEAAGLFALGLVCVVLQRKYFVYHWALAMPFLLQCGAFGLAAFARRSAGLASALAVVVALQGVVEGPVWVSQYYADVAKPITFRDYSAAFWQSQLDPSKALERPFKGPWGFDYADMDAVGSWIAERARPGDTLVVRRFEPVVYAVAGLRSPSRFPSEHVLTEFTEDFAPSVAWKEAHEAAITKARPRFVVTARHLADEERKRLKPVPYEIGLRSGPFVVLVAEEPAAADR